MHKTFTWNITYIHLIYSQKLIVKPEVIDSLIRAIAIKLTRRKKKQAPPPFHLPLKLIPYITDPRSRSWSRKNETKKKETNPETKPNILPLHHLATPSTISCQTERRPSHHTYRSSLLPLQHRSHPVCNACRRWIKKTTMIPHHSRFSVS